MYWTKVSIDSCISLGALDDDEAAVDTQSGGAAHGFTLTVPPGNLATLDYSGAERELRQRLRRTRIPAASPISEGLPRDGQARASAIGRIRG